MLVAFPPFMELERAIYLGAGANSREGKSHEVELHGGEWFSER